ncbi:MAG: hypothetical protein JSS83_16285 [Cyanobacteria bacterium SZAS LIN-3]|nr:hypothetical protein [Cyanobacteria bacterium SZAS LIN-3]
MPETAQAGDPKMRAPKTVVLRSGSGKAAAKAIPPKYGPKAFDPAEHGGVKKRGPIFLFFGVILPALAMIFECTFHFCARHFFDPFPSPAHVVLFGLIPFSNYLVWLGTRRDMSSHYAFMSLASGMATGVACLYSLMFLPLTPLCCFFTLALGFGLLGLAPLLSLPCNLISGKTVCHLAGKKLTYFNAHQVEHIGHMIILVMVVAVELPSTLTRINLSRAADSNPVVAADGVRWLRKYGSAEVLQRACYERSGRATDILGSLYESAHPLSVEETRRIFYQVTGKPFNSVPIPKSARATIQRVGAVADPDGLNAGVEDEFDLDTDIAGEAVSGVARGLSVSQSKFDGKLEPDAALAGLDWSFSFTNDSKFDREARAKILLPPDAVVTKATLTVNNVERDATIMVRSMARARYRRAVVEKKDPLLISTCGKDQILVQCYPVKPGETMKVKLRMAAPLNITRRDKAALVLPAFLERNFEVSAPNDVALHSSKPIAAAGLTPVATAVSGDFEIGGQVDAAHLAGFNAVIEADRDKNTTAAWCKTGKRFGDAVTRRVIEKARYNGVDKLIFVIDGSAAMQQFMPQIAEGLKSLPSTKQAHVQVVGDTVSLLNPGMSAGGSAEMDAVIEKLKSFKAEGGQDDFTALDNALRVATASGAESVGVVWIHAAQPESSAPNANVKAILDQAGPRPLLFDMQLVAGPNEILSNLTPASLVRVQRAGSVADDLAALIAACESVPRPLAALSTPEMPAAEYSVVTTQEEPQAGVEVDDRLAKIWANRQIALDAETPDSARNREATLLASDYQIVSRVSSAIVVSPEPSPVLANIAERKRGFLKVDNPVISLRRSLSQAGREVVSQLNSLSSAASTSGTYDDRSKSAVPAEPPYSVSNGPVGAPVDPRYGQSNENSGTETGNKGPVEALKEQTDQLSTAASAPQAPARSAPGMDPFSSLGAAEDKDVAAPPPAQLQGATNGTVAQFRNLRLEGVVKPAGKAEEMDKSNSYNAADAPADAEAPADAPDAKPVPEADTWMLLAVIFALFGGGYLTKLKRREAKKA